MAAGELCSVCLSEAKKPHWFEKNKREVGSSRLQETTELVSVRARCCGGHRHRRQGQELELAKSLLQFQCADNQCANSVCHPCHWRALTGPRQSAAFALTAPRSPSDPCSLSEHLSPTSCVHCSPSRRRRASLPHHHCSRWDHGRSFFCPYSSTDHCRTLHSTWTYPLSADVLKESTT